MQAWDDEFIDLEVNTTAKKSCFLRILALLWLPLAIFLGIVASYLGFIPFKVELHSVIMIGIIFTIFLFFIKHNAHYAVCRFSNEHERLSQAVKMYVRSNQLTIGEVTKSNASFDDFMQEFSSSFRNDNFASVAAGVFPTLGILGTFISIALSMPDFTSQSSAQLEREISLLLGGVGTAFYVSIYGIFLSLWWIFYEKSGMSRFEKSVAAIKKRLSHHFWGRQEIEQLQFQKSMQNYEKLGSAFAKISSDEFINAIQNTLQQRLELFDSIISHEQNALQKSSTHLSSLKKEGDRALMQSERLLSAYEEIAGAMQKLTFGLDENALIMTKALDKVSQKEQILDDSILKLNDALAPISANNVRDLYATVVQNLEIMKSESVKVGYAFNKNLEEFDEKYTEKLRYSLELIDSETAKVISQIAKLKTMDRR